MAEVGTGTGCLPAEQAAVRVFGAKWFSPTVPKVASGAVWSVARLPLMGGLRLKPFLVPSHLGRLAAQLGRPTQQRGPQCGGGGWWWLAISRPREVQSGAAVEAGRE